MQSLRISQKFSAILNVETSKLWFVVVIFPSSNSPMLLNSYSPLMSSKKDQIYFSMAIGLAVDCCIYVTNTDVFCWWAVRLSSDRTFTLTYHVRHRWNNHLCKSKNFFERDQITILYIYSGLFFIDWLIHLDLHFSLSVHLCFYHSGNQIFWLDTICSG